MTSSWIHLVLWETHARIHEWRLCTQIIPKGKEGTWQGIYYANKLIALSQYTSLKSHNALFHSFVAEICTCMHISVTQWCNDRYLPHVLKDLWDVSLIYIPVFSQFSGIFETLDTYWMECTFLTAVATAQLWCHQSNMNLTQMMLVLILKTQNPN